MSDMSEIEIYDGESSVRPTATSAFEQFKSDNNETHAKYRWFTVIEYDKATRKGAYQCTLCAKTIKTSHGWSDAYILYRN